MRERFLTHFSEDELRIFADAWDRVLPGAAADGLMTAGRERILDTAYELFSRHGTRAVGVDRIIAEAGDGEDDALPPLRLQGRARRWPSSTSASSAGRRTGCSAEVERRSDDPRERLLAIFDVFGEWFALPDFEGCSFINVMLELADPADPVRVASVASTWRRSATSSIELARAGRHRGPRRASRASGTSS